MAQRRLFILLAAFCLAACGSQKPLTTSVVRSMTRSTRKVKARKNRTREDAIFLLYKSRGLEFDDL